MLVVIGNRMWSLFLVLLVPFALSFNNSVNITHVPSNQEEPWGPTSENGYILRGTFDPDAPPLDPELSVSNALVEASAIIKTNAIKGQYEIVYEGPYGGIKVLIQWVTAISRRECFQSLNALETKLRSRADLNNKPLHALIIKNGVGQLLIAVEPERAGEPVDINDQSDLRLEAVFWSERIIDQAETLEAIDRICQNATQYHGPALIPFSEYKEIIGHAALVLSFPPYTITYNSIISLLDSVIDFYYGRVFGELYGDLVLEDTTVGHFKLYLSPNIHYTIPTAGITATNETFLFS